MVGACRLARVQVGRSDGASERLTDEHGDQPHDGNHNGALACGGHEAVELLVVGHRPHDGNHARPAHEGDRDDEEGQEVPDAQHAQAHEEENGAAGEKRRLIRAHLGVAEHVGHGALALGGVALGVAHVVHVHDGHDGKPQRDTGNKAYKREFMQVEEGATHHGHDAEEQKAHEVAQTDVAVGVLADGVADCGGDAGHAEHHEHNDGGPA